VEEYCPSSLFLFPLICLVFFHVSDILEFLDLTPQMPLLIILELFRAH